MRLARKVLLSLPHSFGGALLRDVIIVMPGKGRRKDFWKSLRRHAFAIAANSLARSP
jgi:hypothetical protein